MTWRWNNLANVVEGQEASVTSQVLRCGRPKSGNCGDLPDKLGLVIRKANLLHVVQRLLYALYRI